ncbi:MAG: hypothetical protein LBS44_03780 [Deltaproteobacteria bacterium]|jgi:hypothetical protein|nr:hypothetical protein [Deltaproteobacteria bacterium]
MSKGYIKTPATGLDDRLNCFGTYEPGDQICCRRCALALTCALARNEYLDGQALEGDPRPKPVTRPHCLK